MITNDVVIIYTDLYNKGYPLFECLLYWYIRMYNTYTYTENSSSFFNVSDDELYKALQHLLKDGLIVLEWENEYRYNPEWKTKTKRRKKNTDTVDSDDKEKKEKNEELKNKILILMKAIEDVCIQHWVAYDSRDAWRYTKLILTAKDYNKCAESEWMSWANFAWHIIKKSLDLQYCCKVYWPRDIYYNYVKVLNRIKEENNREQYGNVYHL